MNSIPKVTLEDTLMLLQLVRETALAQGRQEQAEQLSPIMNELNTLVTNSQKAQAAVPPSMGMMGQTDFRTLLDVSTSQVNIGVSQTTPANAAMERNRLIQAMSAANMADVEIARQFGITREEVKLVLSINQKGLASREVSHD